MNGDFQVHEVTSPRELDRFLDVPYEVYRNDPHWVPPLRKSIVRQLSPNSQFSQYGSLQAFVASRAGRPVGRIVAAINQRLIAKEQSQLGLFGFFECIDDFDVAESLFAAAERWLVERGMRRVRGPIDLSTHNNCLFLIDGFDSPPAIMMPYNPAYYPEFAARVGFERAKDAVAYDFPLDRPLSERFLRGYRVAVASGITFRSIRTKGSGFQQDCRALYRLFTEAFEDNWSSTSRTEEEFLEEAQDLKNLARPEIIQIAEHDGRMVGLFMALPDYNIALKHVGGRLNVWGIAKFLWHRRKINSGRVVAICSLPQYQRRMVPLAVIHAGMEGGRHLGYRRAELSWVWEDNSASRRLIEAAGGTVYKRYRIYEKSLTGGAASP